MNIALKIILSALAWLAVVLVTTGGTEIALGGPKTEYASVAIVLILAPVLAFIWRRRTQR